MSSRVRTGYAFAAFLSVAFWGASFAATKIALTQISPTLLVFIRTSIGIVILLMVALVSGGLKQRLSIPWWQLVILGFLGVAFHQWIQAQGLRSTSTTDTGWIIATIPIFVALLGWRFLSERMTSLRILGIALGAIGVVLVISDGRLLHFLKELPDQFGNALILLSALNWAVFTVVSKRWLFVPDSRSQRKLDPGGSFKTMIQAMVWLMILGWLIMLPGVFGEAPAEIFRGLKTSTVGALLFLGIACSGLAYIFWYAALARLDATETSSLLYFEPLVTQAVAWSYLGEPFTAWIIFGGGVILLGVYLVGKR